MTFSKQFFDPFLRPTNKSATMQRGISQDGISLAAGNGVCRLNNISGNLHSL
jgi:hypothetical protein